MKRELSPSNVVSGWNKKKNHVVSLPTTAPPLMMDVRVKYVVAEIASRSEAKLRYAGMNWNECVQTVAGCHKVCAHGVQHSASAPAGGLERPSEDMSEGLPHVMCGPPYNTGRTAELSNSGHYRLKSAGYGPFRGVAFRLDRPEHA